MKSDQITLGTIVFVVLAFVIKVVVAVSLPITGDEAYFVTWGEYPALGYYDHPPLTGWWMAMFLQIFEPSVFIRAPQIVTSFLPALIAFLTLRSSPSIRFFAVVSLLFSPLILINVLFTTDTFYTFFSLLALWLYASRRDALTPIVLFAVGCLLALGFASKYLAVLAGFGILIDQMLFDRQRIRNLLLLVCPAIPIVVLNLWWNYHHCGYNFLFNLVNRQADAALNFSQLASYFGTLFYVLLPVWLALGVYWKQWVRPIDLVTRTWLVVSIAPLALLTLVAIFKPIGLHWLSPFLIGLGLGMLGLLAAVKPSRSFLGLTVVYGLIHAVAIVGISIFPIEDWLAPERANKVKFYKHAEIIVTQLEHTYGPEVMMTTPSYSRAAVIGMHTDEYVPVFGLGSRYGRQSDLVFDAAEFESRTVTVIGSNEAEVAQYQRFFERSEITAMEIADADVFVMIGQGFDSDAYRTEVTEAIRELYYQIPAWLPVGSCAFIQSMD